MDKGRFCQIRDMFQTINKVEIQLQEHLDCQMETNAGEPSED